MLLYPKKYINRITEIDLTFLNENNIKGLILDVDNTLIDIVRNVLEGLEEWANKMIDSGIILYIVSNSNKKDKVKKIADQLNIPFIYFATKPLKRGLRKAAKDMNLSYNNIAVVGDQIFTDVLGANRLKMYSILVEPICEKDFLITRMNRKFESIVKKKIVKKWVWGTDVF